MFILQDNASKKLIAYHEAGHAIVGSLLPHHDAVNKVTVIPRGQAGERYGKVGGGLWWTMVDYGGLLIHCSMNIFITFL